MLYILAHYRHLFGPLRLFEYVTFRSGCAMLTAMFLVILLGPRTIRALKKFCVPKSARLEGLVDEKFVDHSKDKTPTMGGLLIVFAIVVATVFWGDLSNRMVVVFLLTLLPLTALGFYDDYIKVKYERRVRDGISGKMKLLVQAAVSFIAIYIIYKMPDTMTTKFLIPFFKDPICLKPAGEMIDFCLPTQLIAHPLFSFAVIGSVFESGVQVVIHISAVNRLVGIARIVDDLFQPVSDGPESGCRHGVSLPISLRGFRSVSSISANSDRARSFTSGENGGSVSVSIRSQK